MTNPPKMKLLLGMGGVYNKALSFLPGRVAGRIDFSRPLLHQGWGGPMNGQDRRLEIVRELYRAITFATTVETGSFRGHTTRFLAALGAGPVLGVESNPRFHDFAVRACAGNANVDIALDDSRSFLTALVPTLDAPTFYYLDAHWYLDLPLADEVATIAAAGKSAVIMIDDFQIPGDDGYRFDDYGPAGALTLPLLAESGIEEWGVFYPAAPSQDETGLKRGYVVLASPDLVGVVGGLGCLRRPHGVLQ